MIVVDLVWMGGVFGFISAYVYHSAVESRSSVSYSVAQQVPEKSRSTTVPLPQQKLT